MAELWQQVVSGLATGGVYASLALAIVVVHRASGVVNFAQGELATLSTFAAWTLLRGGVPYWAAVPVVLAGALVAGMLLERTVIRRVEHAPAVTAVIVTIGLLILLNGLSAWIWGGEARAFPSMFSTRTIDAGGVVLSVADLGSLGVTLGAAAALAAFLRFTRTGLALRAAAADPASARLAGVRVGRMLALAWGLAALLGALAGLLTAPTSFLDSNMMLPVLFYGLAAALLGGLDSPTGAVLGGLLLGVVLTLAARYVDVFSGEMRVVAALLVVLAVLLLRPTGLLGRRRGVARA